MRLNEILETLVENVPGANAAILADWEGEAVATYTSGENTDYNIKFVGAHHGLLLGKAREMIERLSLGQPREITFLQDLFHVITIPINQDYYLVLTLLPDSIPAMAKHKASRAAREIEIEIA